MQIARPAVWVSFAIAVTTAARFLYSLQVDPLSAPDASSYHQAGMAIAARGPFAGDIPGVPYWPIGYPALVGAAYAVFGVGTPMIGIVQGLLLGAAAWSLYVGTRKTVGETTASLAAIMLTANPALSAASGRLMYETLLAALLTFGFALFLRNPRKPMAACLVVGLASVVQPKALLVGIGCLVWLFGTRRPQILALCLAALLVAPLPVVILNNVNYGVWIISANLGTTMRTGFNDHADGTYSSFGPGLTEGCDTSGDLFVRDRALVRCSVEWIAENPGHLPKLEAMKAVAFWSPFVGPFTMRGTWYSDLDFRSLYPAWITESDPFEKIDVVATNLWMAASLGLIAVGAVALGRRHRLVVLTCLWTIAAFLIMSLLTIGDARYRLPAAPFYHLLQASGLLVVIQWLGSRSPTLRERFPHLRNVLDT